MTLVRYYGNSALIVIFLITNLMTPFAYEHMQSDMKT